MFAPIARRVDEARRRPEAKQARIEHLLTAAVLALSIIVPTALAYWLYCKSSGVTRARIGRSSTGAVLRDRSRDAIGLEGLLLNDGQFSQASSSSGESASGAQNINDSLGENLDESQQNSCVAADHDESNISRQNHADIHLLTDNYVHFQTLLNNKINSNPLLSYFRNVAIFFYELFIAIIKFPFKSIYNKFFGVKAQKWGHRKGGKRLGS